MVESVVGKTIAIDGKTVCSTAKIKKYDSPLHIASAFVVENGITIGQLATEAKSNEIPIVRELVRILDVTGATIVTDAQKRQPMRYLNRERITSSLSRKIKKNYMKI